MMKYWGNSGIPQRILNLGTRGRCVVGFTPGARGLDTHNSWATNCEGGACYLSM